MDGPMICSLATFVNAIPQRRDEFISLQLKVQSFKYETDQSLSALNIVSLAFYELDKWRQVDMPVTDKDTD
ncbi:hypothetical protein PENANT_c008G01248 [Penicillium antarcticum]|uniref:Uncharacterized protein n=1 Tax=Penicillium antarcticum TaxID=416450 RepID=A0A1V6QAN0_9EURO|nr:hypothetical protein PENANT_c008G01248 [Penicillium antarcticum]